MRRVIPLLCILLLLCGCGGGQSVSAPDEAARLVIFTARSAAAYDDTVREFERRTGIWVEVRTADGTLPLLDEIAAGDPGCDLLLGAAPDCLSAYGDCFAPYAAPLAADIPDAYRDSEDRWTAFSLLPMVLLYNDHLVQRNVPDSWSGLLDTAWRGRIACPDPTVSATGCTVLQALTQALPSEDETVLAAFSHNLSGVLPSAADTVDAVADGSCYVGVATEDLALQAADNGFSVTVVYPAEGTVIQPDCAAVVQGCLHEDNARAFIDFLLSDEVQTRLTRQSRRAVRGQAAASAALPRAMAYDAYAAGARQAELLAIWQSLTAEAAS